MFKHIISMLMGLVIIAVAFVDLSAVAQIWVLTIAGAIVFFISLFDVFEDQDAQQYLSGQV